MTARTPAIGRIRTVIYVRGADAAEEERAVVACRRWADDHDWQVAAVVRETSDAEVPLERLGLRTALGLLDGGRATVLFVSTRLQVAGEDADFHEVCALAERSGGFLHVLDTPREIDDVQP